MSTSACMHTIIPAFHTFICRDEQWWALYHSQWAPSRD